jgi:hypothetical protein
MENLIANVIARADALSARGNPRLNGEYLSLEHFPFNRRLLRSPKPLARNDRCGEGA